MPDEQKIQTEIELLRTRADIAKIDQWYFLQYFTFTKDEHDKSTLHKPFPRRAYLRILCRIWREIDLFFMEKSRQVMVSWLFCALYLHDAMFNQARLIFLQSKKQEDADALLDRCRHIRDSADQLTTPIIGQWLPKVRTTGLKSGTNDKMEFPTMGSKIQSIPQGPEIVQSHTPSGIFADEMNLQRQFAEGYGGAQPGITGGGRYTAVGTANGYTFGYHVLNGLDDRTGKSLGPHQFDSRNIKDKRLVAPTGLTPEQARYWIEDKILNMPDAEFDAIPLVELIACMPGMAYWRTADGIDCFRLHYTADPDKDPVTAKGAVWVPEAKRRMKSRTRWEREMEIKYDTFEGRPVISNWESSRFVREIDYDSELALHLSHDFGTIKCLTFFAQYRPLTIEGQVYHQLYILNEIVLDNSDTPTLATETVIRMERQFGRSWRQRNIRSYCDPNGDRQEPTNADKSLNTSIKILRAHGIYSSNKKFGCVESTELIETVFSLELPNGEPAILIHPRCTYLISCCAGGLHYPEKGKGTPGHYEKDGVFDHGGDALRYLIANLFTQYDLTGRDAPAYRQPQAVYEEYTGRTIGYKRSTRIEPMGRGKHAVHL